MTPRKTKTQPTTDRRKDEDADLLAVPGLESLSKLTADLLHVPKPTEETPKRPRRKSRSS